VLTGGPQPAYRGQVHKVDAFRFIDTSDLSDEEGENTMAPWPSAELIIEALAPCWPEVLRELQVEPADLESAASLISGDLLAERGADYFPRAQLESPCRLLLELAMCRKAADPNVFSTEFSSVQVGVGLAYAPNPPDVERAKVVLEQALEAANLSGLTSDDEDEDEDP
jgi:hypothetical protein